MCLRWLALTSHAGCLELISVAISLGSAQTALVSRPEIGRRWAAACPRAGSTQSYTHLLPCSGSGVASDFWSQCTLSHRTLCMSFWGRGSRESPVHLLLVFHITTDRPDLPLQGRMAQEGPEESKADSRNGGKYYPVSSIERQRPQGTRNFLNPVLQMCTLLCS